jgi:hypothetical protein
MATLIIKKSNGAKYLLSGSKMVALGAFTEERMPTLECDDATVTALLAAYPSA